MAKRITVPDSPEAISGVSIAEMIRKQLEAVLAQQASAIPPAVVPAAASAQPPATKAVSNGKKAPVATFSPAEPEGGITASMTIANGVVTITFPQPNQNQWHKSQSGKSQTVYARIPASRSGNVVLGGGVNLWFK